MTQDLRTYHNFGDRHFFADKPTMTTLMLIEIGVPKDRWENYLGILLAVSVVYCFQRNIDYRGRPIINEECIMMASELYEKAAKATS